MKRLKRFFALCSVLLYISVCETLEDGSNLSSNQSSDLMTQLLAKFKVDYHHSLQSVRTRKKREAGLLGALTDENAFIKEHLQVENYISEDLPYLEAYNLTFWTSVFHEGKNGLLVGTAEGHLILFELKNGTATTVASSSREIVGHKAKAFSQNKEQWFVILQRSSNGSYITLYTRIARGLESRQTIYLDGDSDFDLITVRGVHYIAVSTYTTKSQGHVDQSNIYTPDKECCLRLYHWTRTQLDLIASSTVYGARSVACWSLYGSLYVSVALETYEDWNLYLGSPVFVYNAKEEKGLVLAEALSTGSRRKCVHFLVSGSHYLIFTGDSDAVIYWWAGNQFLEWQTIPRSAGAVDVAILSMADGEAAIVIALKDKIMFLTLDTAGYYTVTYVKNFGGYLISSLQFMWDGANYFALALFGMSLHAPRPHPTWRLGLGTYSLPSVAAMDSLLRCLHDVRERLEERQEEIQAFNSRADKLWLLNKEQEIPGNVIVKGLVVSENRPVKAELIQIVSTETNVPSWSPTEVNEKIDKLSILDADVTSHATNSLSKSTPQDISGVMNFTGLVTTPSLSVKHLPKDFILNGIPVSTLLTKTLKISGDQSFSETLYLKGLTVDTAEASQINGLNTSDFVLLHGEQVISGSLDFSDVKGTDVVTGPKGVLNSIPLDQLITRNSDQDIYGLKSFSFLKADVIEVHGNTNGEDLPELAKKIVTTDGGHISGNIEFTAPLEIEGDMLLSGLINNAVNISHLIHQGVDKYSDQDITGAKTFLAPVTVKEDFNLEGTINGIDLDKDVITLSGDQEIFGNVTFVSNVTFEKDLFTDSVNGIDLDVKAVIRKDGQFIEGQKIFRSELVADEIKMGEAVTLDYVDPSELEKVLVQHENGVVTDSVVLNSVVVLGDLVADQGINNFSVKDLPDVMYLKSRPQEIKVPVLFPGPIIVENLEVDLINHLDLDKDVVHSYGDEEILSTKEFPDGIHVVNSLNIQRGRLFGGSDINSFGDLDKPYDESTARGIKILPFLYVKGDITADWINGLNLPGDLMLTNKPQKVAGNHIYNSGVVLGDLQARNVMPGTVNHINFGDFVYNAVPRNPTSTRVISNKTFSEISASTLHTPAQSKLDGVSLPEMMLKVATLNKPELMSADTTFTGSLQFKGPVSATRVNDLDLASHIHNVIFLDNKAVIRGNKTIHGELHVSDLMVRHPINGVDLAELAENAVYKSRRNEITVPMTFSSDLDIGSLFVEKPALIDGTSLEDVALVKEDTYISSAELTSDVFISGNMHVGGLVNGCDLNLVLQDSLKLHGSEQVLTGYVELYSLNVTGSVTFRDTVSDIKIADLFKVITRSGHRVIKGNFHFTSGIAAHSLQIKGPIDGIDLNEIVRDAVRKSLPQEITGYKHFGDDLEIGILEGSGELFVTGKVNNVNIEELMEDVVWKRGTQVISGEKIFGNVYANNVTILGYLNGLKLPEDVVLTYTSDKIPGAVYLMKDLVIQSNLTVNGRIDGVDLNTFLRRRVTLKADEELESEVIFKKDLTIEGNLLVDGTVNDVVLEMAVKNYKDNQIKGIKQFNDLTVHGHVLSNFINGYNLTELLSSLIRLDDEVVLHGSQVFLQPLHLTSAVVGSINGIDLGLLESTYLNASKKIIAIESFFDGENKLQQDQIAKQMEAALYQISDFAYFVQIQELHFHGASDKIITGYRIRSQGNLFYQHIVLWITQTTCATPNKCCKLQFSYRMEANDNGYLTARNEPEEGRYFPVIGPNLFPSDGNFMVWTNTTVTQPTWCYSKIRETTEIGTVEGSSLKSLMTVKNSPLLTDIKAFREGKLYIVAGYYHDKRSGEYSRSVVYDYNDMRKEWKEHQLLSAYGVLAMDITSFKTDTTILLAVGTGLGSYPDSDLFLYKWKDAERKFAEIQRRPSDYVTSILWVDNQSSKLLVVSSVEYWSSSNECAEEASGGQIDVFEYYNDLKWIQSLPLKGVVSVVSFKVAGETFLAAASRQMGTIYILRWKGFGKFSMVQSIYSPGVRHINTYSRRNEVFITIASASGKSTVLKAVLRGKTYYQRSQMEFPVELNDAPYAFESSQTVC